MRHSARARSVSKQAASALTVGLFLAYLIALPPHLVHHLFDDDHTRPACSHLALSQQTPELQTDSFILTPPIATETLGVSLSGASLSFRDLTVSHPRAPPRLTPSA